MRRFYGVTDERTQMAKIRYLQMKDDTQRFICRTLHDHTGIVMQKLKEDGSKKRMFNHIKSLMRKHRKGSGEILGQSVLHKWESDTMTEKGDDWKWYDK